VIFSTHDTVVDLLCLGGFEHAAEEMRVMAFVLCDMGGRRFPLSSCKSHSTASDKIESSESNTAGNFEVLKKAASSSP
jgi:hypothetical protein